MKNKNCIICNNNKFILAFPFGTYYNKKNFKYYKCKNCSFVAIDPYPNKFDFKKLYTFNLRPLDDEFKISPINSVPTYIFCASIYQTPLDFLIHGSSPEYKFIVPKVEWLSVLKVTLLLFNIIFIGSDEIDNNESLPLHSIGGTTYVGIWLSHDILIDLAFVLEF